MPNKRSQSQAGNQPVAVNAKTPKNNFFEEKPKSIHQEAPVAENQEIKMPPKEKIVPKEKKPTYEGPFYTSNPK